jgi:extracellular elastinolytic metalloproteinase
MHDVTYAFGFTEVAGNFQRSNFGRGGQENDAVEAFTQDPDTQNTASFVTPPDGQPGRMNMHVWKRTTPARDPTYDAGIVIHEHGHGVSTRLTGGPSRADCLRSGESGGMGEGWSDSLAFAVHSQQQDTRARITSMGSYSTNNPNGIRRFPYSTNMTTNPSTYSFIEQSDYRGRVHRVGEVWAAMLYEVFWCAPWCFHA